MFALIFFTCLIVTFVTPACIGGHETHTDIDSPGMESGISNVHISVGNSEWRTPCSCKKGSYLIGTEKVTWFQAYVLCKQSGMELASIASVDEEIAMENYTRNFDIKVGPYEGYWLAGTRHGSCGSDFVWLTTGKPVVYRKFSAGQPDNAGGVEACLELFLNGPNVFAWNDIPCDQKLGYICQPTCCWSNQNTC